MKKRRYLTQVLLVLAIFVFSSMPVKAEEAIPGAVKTAAENVVQVICETNLGEEEGAGFVVSKQVRKDEKDDKKDDDKKDDKKDDDKKEDDEKEEKKMYVVTSYHLVEANKKHLTVKWKKQTVEAKAVGYFPTQDVAILELSEDIKDIKMLPLRKDEQKNDTKIYPVGYQFDEKEIRNRKGKIISKKDMVVTQGRDAISVYETDAKLNNENLGGPTLDKSGYVVGVNFYNGNSGAIITEKELIYFLDEKNVEYKTFQMNWMFVIVPVCAVILLIFILVLVKSKKKKAKPLQAYVVGTQGDFGGQDFPLEPGKQIWFGRNSKECQIVFSKNTKVSRKHCSLFYDADSQTFILADLNSSNGTWVGEMQLDPSSPAALKSGEEFYIGDKSIAFRVEVRKEG